MDDYGNEVRLRGEHGPEVFIPILLDGRAIAEAIVSLRRGDGDEA